MSDVECETVFVKRGNKKVIIDDSFGFLMAMDAGMRAENEDDFMELCEKYGLTVIDTREENA